MATGIIACFTCQRQFYADDAYTKGRRKPALDHGPKINFKDIRNRPWYCHDCIEHEQAPSFVIQQHQHRLD